MTVSNSFSLPFFVVVGIAGGLVQSVFGQLICIDPGHPSEVGRGATSRQISEIEAAWRVALNVKTRLEKKGYSVVVTKQSQDHFVKNIDRARIANRSNADLFLRLHCDAAQGTGFAVYYPNRVGKSGKKVGPTRELITRIKPIAERFHLEMAKSLKGIHRNNGLKTDFETLIGSKQGALTGSIYSEVPVVLIEMCILTNPKDAAWMATQRGQDQMSTAILAGILKAVPLKEGSRLATPSPKAR